MVSSFFDIFAEFSVDGGLTWDVPEGWSTDGGNTWKYGNVPPLHFESIPEPATMMLLGFGGLLIARRQTSY
jgi:hypothetical protein